MFFRISVTNWHSIVIAAEGSIITLVVNMNTCKYNWKGLNESAFPAHLYLSQFYIFRDHAVNFTVDLMQGVFIDRFHHIDPTKTSPYCCTVSEVGVLKLLQKQQIHKKAGADSIGPQTLKECSTAVRIALILTPIYKTSYESRENTRRLENCMGSTCF